MTNQNQSLLCLFTSMHLSVLYTLQVNCQLCPSFCILIFLMILLHVCYLILWNPSWRKCALLFFGVRADVLNFSQETNIFISTNILSSAFIYYPLIYCSHALKTTFCILLTMDGTDQKMHCYFTSHQERNTYGQLNYNIMLSYQL